MAAERSSTRKHKELTITFIKETIDMALSIVSSCLRSDRHGVEYTFILIE